jgi:lipopolysaccharide export system protein LptC
MPGHVVDAIGMRVDLARKHVELQAQVRGQHEFESD